MIFLDTTFFCVEAATLRSGGFFLQPPYFLFSYRNIGRILRTELYEKNRRCSLIVSHHLTQTAISPDYEP